MTALYLCTKLWISGEDWRSITFFDKLKFYRFNLNMIYFLWERVTAWTSFKINTFLKGGQFWNRFSCVSYLKQASKFVACYWSIFGAGNKRLCMCSLIVKLSMVKQWNACAGKWVLILLPQQFQLEMWRILLHRSVQSNLIMTDYQWLKNKFGILKQIKLKQGSSVRTALILSLLWFLMLWALKNVENNKIVENAQL
jgi:carbon starvation protein CstA